jgi:signal transduction histidine kinase
MRQSQMKRFFKTFRFRLAAWNAAVVILTAAVTLIVLRQGVHWAMLHEIDQILAEDISEISLSIDDLADGDIGLLQQDLVRKAVGHQHHGWFVQLFAGDGGLIWSSSEAPKLPPPSRRSNSKETSGILRLASREIPPGPHGIASIRVGTSLALLYEDMARIDRTVMIAISLVLILAPAIGYWLASRAVRPVRAITRTAAKLRPSHLEERLPIRGTNDELDRLAQTVNGLLDRIALDVQQKRDLLANAAHELRTPMAAIRSSVEVALNSSRSAEEYEELLVEIIDQGASLETLVNQLLLLSETETEHLKQDFYFVPLDVVVSRAVDMFQGVAESRSIELTLQCNSGVQVYGNANLLRQLANNLIDNAIKYTPAGGHVRVALTVDPQHETAIFSVADSGIGIAPADVPHVFERFFRADRSRTRFKDTIGTGLGLSICQAVVTAHGGSIQCHSEVSAGTVMTVTLPLAPDAQATTVRARAALSSTQP